MAEEKNYPKRKEIRKLICKGCRREIDEMGCATGCKYDVMNFGDRKPENMEYLVYVCIFSRIEPYFTSQSGKKK